MDDEMKDFQFALKIFHEVEGREANLNDETEMLLVSAIQLGVTHQRLNE
jgi:hypothetical protein